MGFSAHRLSKVARTTCAPFTAVLGFSVLLTIVFILYQPTRGPDDLQKLGWQSWATVSPKPATNGDVATNNTTTQGDQTGSGNIPPGTDWWDVETPEPEIESSSLPLDVWDPLMPHDTGLAEIAIEKCFIDPELVRGMCVPHSATHEDAVKGKWVRVGPDLNQETSMTYLNIYYRRTRRLDVPLITELKLLPEGEQPESMSDAWHKVPKSTRTGVTSLPPQYLWYKAEKTGREMTEDEKKNDLITELDVTYGEDIPWYGFEKLSPPTTPELQDRRQSVYITFRRGVKRPPRAPPLHFSRDGKFRILQVADLHFSVSPGVCRDSPISPCDGSDNLTSTLLAKVLDAERPDLIVFTGDQLNGQGTSWDAKSVLAKFAKVVTQRQIPWAAVFGNHDEEDGDAKMAQLRYMQGLPYSLVQAGPPDIHGVGNYVLKVKSADASKTHLLTLYFLDSGSYVSGIMDWLGLFHGSEYDWIRENQINWFLQESASIKPIERPFTPDGTKDLASVWRRQGLNQITPDTRKLAKPNAIMFFHIPLQESYSKADVDPTTGRPLDLGISDLEGKGSAKGNAGFFEKGLMAALESTHRTRGSHTEVKVIANGHCHITDNCRRVKGIWSCFAGGGSYSGYGKLGFDRRFRIFDISNYGETIRTYKRTEHDEIIDKMPLVGEGAPGPWEGFDGRFSSGPCIGLLNVSL